MKNILSALIDKKFKVYVGGEYERSCDFLGLMQLLSNWSDFFSYSPAEKRDYLSSLLKEKVADVDADIWVKF